MVAKRRAVDASRGNGRGGISGPKKKKKSKVQPVESMDMDEFMRAGGGSDSCGDDGEEPVKARKIEDDDGDEHVSASEHKSTLARLKKQDPEFYKFLEKEDKELLDFDISDDDEQADSEGDADDDDDVEKSGERKQEQESDSADEAAAGDEDGASADGGDGEDAGRHRRRVTLAMVKRWARGLKESSSDVPLRTVVAAFRAAVDQNGGADDSDAAAPTVGSDSQMYLVKDSSVFNAIVRLCLTQLLPAVAARLKLPMPDASSSAPDEGVAGAGERIPQPSNSKHWTRLKVHIKYYLQDVVRLITALPQSHSLNPVLKHVTQLVPYYACFPKLSKSLVKRLTSVWSTGEETPRVLAFFSIIKLVRLQQAALLERTIKIMYLAYVRNTKFTSPSTLTLIVFMQRSLVELLALNHDLAYQHAFVYIRQLAIHLRNAVVTKKKDAQQTVYSWQFVHSLGLWARLVSTVFPSDSLQQLIYPLVQLIVGTARLIPTAKFYPLRFYCVRLLNLIATKTRTYIPVLPLLLEVLQATDFNKKFSRASVKPFDFSCMLKLSKAQLQDRAFKDGTVEQLYELILDSMNIYAHTIGFPELILPAVVQMRAFTKKCKVAAYCKQIKQLVEKAEETSRVINQRRSTASFGLADTAAVDAWEAKSKEDSTPVGKYWQQWQKVRAREAAQLAAAAAADSSAKPNAKKGREKSRQEAAKERRGAGIDDSESDYSDLNSDELEELAKSADEEDSEADAEVEEEIPESKASLSKANGSGKFKSDPSGDANSDVEDGGDVVKDFTWSESEDESDGSG